MLYHGTMCQLSSTVSEFRHFVSIIVYGMYQLFGAQKVRAFLSFGTTDVGLTKQRCSSRPAKPIANGGVEFRKCMPTF